MDGALKRKKRVLSLLMFKALKWNMFRITAYKDVIFMRQFHQSATNRYQLLSIYLLIVTENRYQSITTQILAIDGSSIIHIKWLIDIDWYRLSNLLIGYPGICNETNAQKRSCWHCNIWPDWCTSHQSHYFLLYNGIPEFMRKPLMLTVK